MEQNIYPEKLPKGVLIVPINMNTDSRGVLAEFHRKEPSIGFEILQWNIVHSKKNVLRGVHLHFTHADYLIVPHGSMCLCLHDVRPNSVTKNQTFTVHLNENNFRGVVIPSGIAHGFYFNEVSTLIYGVSAYWNPKDELACKWNSPEIHMQWPTHNPILSERDASAPSYQEMLNKFLNLWQQNETLLEST